MNLKNIIFFILVLFSSALSGQEIYGTGGGSGGGTADGVVTAGAFDGSQINFTVTDGTDFSVALSEFELGTAAPVGTPTVSQKAFYDATADVLYINDGGVWAAYSSGGATNLTVTNNTATALTIESDTGTDVVLSGATTTLAGLLSAADKAKLDLITVTGAANLDDMLDSLTAHRVDINALIAAQITVTDGFASTSITEAGSANNDKVLKDTTEQLRTDINLIRQKEVIQYDRIGDVLTLTFKDLTTKSVFIRDVSEVTDAAIGTTALATAKIGWDEATGKMYYVDAAGLWQAVPQAVDERANIFVGTGTALLDQGAYALLSENQQMTFIPDGGSWFLSNPSGTIDTLDATGVSGTASNPYEVKQGKKAVGKCAGTDCVFQIIDLENSSDAITINEVAYGNATSTGITSDQGLYLIGNSLISTSVTNGVGIMPASSTTYGVFGRGANNSSASLLILAGSNRVAALNFGDQNDEDAGQINYNHTDDYMNFRVNGRDDVLVLRSEGIASGRIGINDITPETLKDATLYGNCSAAISEAIYFQTVGGKSIFRIQNNNSFQNRHKVAFSAELHSNAMMYLRDSLNVTTDTTLLFENYVGTNILSVTNEGRIQGEGYNAASTFTTGGTAPAYFDDDGVLVRGSETAPNFIDLVTSGTTTTVTASGETFVYANADDAVNLDPTSMSAGAKITIKTIGASNANPVTLTALSGNLVDILSDVGTTTSKTFEIDGEAATYFFNGSDFIRYN